MRKADETRVVGYTRESEQKVCKALDEMHNVVQPTETEGSALSRAYLVIRFTETDNGLAASLGMFGEEDTPFGKDSDMIKAAKGTADTSLATIASHIASQQLSEQLADMVELAISVRQGAASFSELSPAQQELAEKEVREELMEREFNALKTEGEA